MARNRREVAAELDRQERRSASPKLRGSSASPKRGQRAASRHARAAEGRGGGADRGGAAEVDDPIASRWLQLSDKDTKSDGWSGYGRAGY